MRRLMNNDILPRSHILIAPLKALENIQRFQIKLQRSVSFFNASSFEKSSIAKNYLSTMVSRCRPT